VDQQPAIPNYTIEGFLNAENHGPVIARDALAAVLKGMPCH